MALHSLAAAFAETGQFDEAKQTIQKAMTQARTGGQNDLVERFGGELKRYEAGLPVRE